MCEKRILIVDDDTSILEMLKDGIEASCTNCGVVLANNPLVALRLLETQQFDLILTDYDMPGMNGLDLARAARQTWPDTRVVLMSGWLNPTSLQGQARALDLAGFVQKPFNLSEIWQVL